MELCQADGSCARFPKPADTACASTKGTLLTHIYTPYKYTHTPRQYSHERGHTHIHTHHTHHAYTHNTHKHASRSKTPLSVARISTYSTRTRTHTSAYTPNLKKKSHHWIFFSQLINAALAIATRKETACRFLSQT